MEIFAEHGIKRYSYRGEVSKHHVGAECEREL
jgi:hypothetical protein